MRKEEKFFAHKRKIMCAQRKNFLRIEFFRWRISQKSPLYMAKFPCNPTLFLRGFAYSTMG
jgi:hypothetical protein